MPKNKQFHSFKGMEEAPLNIFTKPSDKPNKFVNFQAQPNLKLHLVVRSSTNFIAPECKIRSTEKTKPGDLICIDMVLLISNLK